MVRRRTHEFPSVSGQSTLCWRRYPVHQDTKLTGRQVNEHVHIQLVREILVHGGVDKVHVTLEELETSAHVSVSRTLRRMSS